MKWLILSAAAAAVGLVSGYLFSVFRPQTHNIASLFGDLMFGGLVAVVVLLAGWFWIIRRVP
jgi:Na+/serine symporter